MTPLQAAMTAGFVLMIMFGIYMLIGIPLLTILFMKTYWKISNQQERIKNKVAYYKDPIAFVVSILFVFGILLLSFYLFVMSLDKIFPGFGYSN